mmetsp:Transcript_9553/g.14378  ORF Transcript_9553/g.14378 Transcript_9553/m.14378 type:complete len:296 (-) Transcript_9553:102-989(-)
MDPSSFLAGTVSGALATETKESILGQELEKLQEKKNKLKEDNTKYVSNHPELSVIIDEFVADVLQKKPHDIVKFGEKFFSKRARKSQKINDLSGLPPLVIAGPSGVGKGTIISKLVASYPALFGFSVSHTTRAPRAGEVDGVQYNFVSSDEMTEAISAGKFIEHAHVHSNYYGTSFEAVQCIQAEGKICILDIDIQGVQSVKGSGLDCRYIFIAPPTIDELERRLRGRMSESDDKIRIRLENARGEIAYGMEKGNFDAVVVNDSIETTFEEIVRFLRHWYPNFEFGGVPDDEEED